MKIIRNKIVPFRGFIAINLFGVLFVRKEIQPPYNFSPREWDKVLNHELIHTKQMQELLYLPFYVLYLLEWLVRIVMYRDKCKAYRNISFEREAYENERDPYYLKNRIPFDFLKYLRG